MHTFARNLVSRTSKQVSRNSGPLWQPGVANGAAPYRSAKSPTPQKCSGECSERCRPETGCSGKCSGNLFLEETQGPSTSPSTPFLAGTSPSTLPSTFGGLGVLLGQESCRTKVSRIFRIFVPNFAPNFAPNFPRIFDDFSHFVSWETETRKNSPKIPAIFQCKIPRQTPKKYSQNSSGEQAK